MEEFLGFDDFKASDSNLVRLVEKPKCFLCPLPVLKPRAEVGLSIQNRFFYAATFNSQLLDFEVPRRVGEDGQAAVRDGPPLRPQHHLHR